MDRLVKNIPVGGVIPPNKERQRQRSGKIDKMGLGARVLEWRKYLTCEEIADEINRKYLPAGMEPLNKMTVSRYCTDRGMTDMDRNDIKKDLTRFDCLSESWDVRNRLLKHNSKLQKLWDNIKEDEEKLSELASISNAYLKSCDQLQTLNERVSKLQKEQLGVEKVRKAMRLLIETLEKYPEVKADYFQRLRESDLYDLIRSI